ncbi:proteasome assembly chaperone family protein [Ferroplasma acidiphilum]|uniref:Proteasome assembly chaperone family protein n=1 Tax=Ferroplasma acidiphilum TaxID=74969 RepID=A0A7K4FM53_9ARCH|nr:proteasome assembly chaperone family protein [Ferroplasma acidiphilum]NOL60086.1 proteasome assembly chaperone family protein [Ferroplasma acidiphilum]WMT52606.1 MAG: proteasome assembly chaperone family protein [Ferroplasma acidiphilum]
MEKIMFKNYEEPELNSPIFVGGLPGIGNVGKITVDYFVDKLKMKKLADVYSEFLPPQVFINNNVVHLVRESLYYKKTSGEHDLIFLTGDFQGTTQEGQYELSYRMLEFLKKYEVSMIYTLGGYSVGKIVEKPRVLGAVTDKKLIKPLARKGVIFSEGEPSGGIVGSAGLILGMGTELFSIPGACFMGETSGYFADPKSAREIIMVLAKVLKTRINLKDIDEKTRQLEDITEKMKQEAQNKAPKDDLGYFG